MLVVLSCTATGALAGAADAAPAVGPTATATPSDSSDPAATRATSTTYSATDFENRLYARTNNRRLRHGCRPIRQNAALALAARLHSIRMSDSSELSHRLADELDLDGRAVAAGYTSWRMLGENLAWGQATPGQVFREWLHSAGHRANLDSCRMRDVGVAVVIRGGEPWITEDFGRRR